MPIITPEPPQPWPGSSSVSLKTLWVSLFAWNSSARSGGAYINYTLPLQGSYSVNVSFLEGTAKYCTEYYAENTTLVFNRTTGRSLPVRYYLFKQKSVDITKRMTIQLSNPQSIGGWPMGAAMPYNTRDSVLDIRPYEEDVVNTGKKTTQVTVTVSYTIPDQMQLCKSAALLQDAIGKTTKKTTTTSYVSIRMRGFVVCSLQTHVKMTCFKLIQSFLWILKSQINLCTNALIYIYTFPHV
jgi:hypothetical protein